MILGVGIDIVEVQRFAHWHKFTEATLHRIFAQEEINYCLSKGTASGAHFAARFAAKEAFSKALGGFCPDSIPLLTLAKRVWVTKLEHGAPRLVVDWPELHKLCKETLPEITPHVSLSHTKTLATAVVVLEKA